MFLEEFVFLCFSSLFSMWCWNLKYTELHDENKTCSTREIVATTLLFSFLVHTAWKLPWHHGACTHALVALPSCCRRRTGPHTKLSLVEDLAIEEPEVHEHRAATAGFVRIDMSKRSSWTTAYPSTCRSTRVVDAERWWTDRKDYCGTGGRRLIAGRRKCVVRRGEDGGNRETHGQRARWEVRRK